MASALLSYLQALWPFSALLREEDDLRASARLIGPLSVPEETKQFVLALREPGGSTQDPHRDGAGVIYILAAQNLSEQSASDAERLIREVRPRAVVTQVARTALEDVRIEEDCLAGSGSGGVPVPASPFQVIKRCVTEKRSKDQYVKAAACQVLQEIFGVGFYGHLLAAKRAAEETGSCFLLLESPYERNCGGGGSVSRNSTTDNNSAQPLQASCSLAHSTMDDDSGLQLQANCLIPRSAMTSHGSKICLMDDNGGQLLKSLAPTLNFLMSQAVPSNAATEYRPSECKPADRYEAPQFAQSVYPLLADLYHIFVDIPSIGKAMASAQKLLTQVHEGEPISSDMLSDVYVFRIAIEALRMGLNNAARSHIDTRDKHGSKDLDFSDLQSDEKCHILLAQALRSQLREFGSVVAIVDASCLAGIRRHWNTPVPSEITQLASRCFNHYGAENDDKIEVPSADSTDKKSWISEKPVVAVGAGGTALLGFSSLSKSLQASAFLKLAPYKSPVVLKYALMQLQRHAAIVLSKMLPHGFVTAGSKASALQFTASAEKIRAVAHTVISSAERTSLLAMRTSFYEIMQKRHRQPFRITPWATFGCSMVACAGLVMHGDGIECAAEAAPSVPMIASLGRGLESLRLTSQEVRQTKGQNVKEALRALMNSLKKSAK
ncbi:hypothetical protein BDA96_06G143900 [Sorghum bicolor]|jgi:hypothetical protein|uniref:Uncharacterized protein n=2 Tax=Sorghum bicolor TaxID=4558 RepID=A0A921QSJ0_SORBI|nr:uncharacterized protein LOC8060181 [Sorghum bicolor]KAG0526415.1 hypothetical protein BDA96_06G143900 [Sorghum bicolor]KXG26616.1 hypothetical protein SORBI_3006G130200 [Sorghum bicolor]|eukprot:XP_021318831.1 uncharacterized protein LOC8060181 [Sorghum bicolor]